MKANRNKLVMVLFLLSALAGRANDTVKPGPQTESLEAKAYGKLYYVDVLKGSDNGKGSKEAPWKSIKAAVQNAVADGPGRTAILVAEGTYAEGAITLKSKVDLLGGFSHNNWQRDIQKFGTVINGNGKQQLLIAASDVRIDGFTLTNGSVLGNGAAILCKGVSPTITNNVFSNNKTLKPVNWQPKYLHLTANDGGAIYGDEGAAPIIKNNLFVNNTTENGRGAAVAFNNKCKPVIDHNVFVNNRAGLDDPMRSSDGGGISVFNWCDAVISNNLFLSNKALSKNDGGAVFVALWSSAKILNNIVVDSESGDDAGALFVGGQEHRYDAPLDPIPSKDKFYVTIDHNQLFGNRNPSGNSGVMRFTMEARGEFTNNVTAFNTGVYFQRSEVAVNHNLILDNFLFIETKEGLRQGSIENNFIGGNFSLETPAKVENNQMKDAYEGGKNNKKGLPKIKADGSFLNATTAIFDKSVHTTDILVSSSFAKNSLVNRVIKAGDRWGIVKSNEGSLLTVWGDLNGATSLNLLPTYSIVLN